MNYEKQRKSYYGVPGIILGLLDDEEEEQIEEDVKKSRADERRAFWESQEELLKENLCRTTLFEAKIKRATEDVLRKLNYSGGGVRCSCRRRMAAVCCPSCSLNEVSVQLQNSGLDCVICYSNWKSSPKIPAGQHTYLEVTEKTTPSGSGKGEKKVIIELNFREEFEMARSNLEYNHLITKLSEVFVGKAERLGDLVNILCNCSKRCMKERKMHLAPWRKCSYMQAKWQLAAVAAAMVEQPKAPPKQRVSLVSFDFLEDLLPIRCQNNKAVKVV